MRDQASTLRNLIQRQPTLSNSSRPHARVVTFTSGKGGVGKSNLALNVAVALSQLGARVCVLDANPGLSNIDLLCGLNCYWNLSHVLTGAKLLSEVVLKGPEGINILPGASGLIELADISHRQSPELCEQIEMLESAYDFLIVDTGAGLQRSSSHFAVAADVTFIVATPEPTAIADAYATLKSWHAEFSICPEVIVNRAESEEQAAQILGRIAQTIELFLRCSAPTGCWVAEDDVVRQAVIARQPFLLLASDSVATKGVRQIAKRLFAGPRSNQSESLIQRLSNYVTERI